MGQPATPLRGRGPASLPVRADDAVADVIVLDHHRRRRQPTAVYVRRRMLAAAVLIVLVALVIVGAGRIGASAGAEDVVAGHDVVAPGDTLWDVATEHAPPGTDPRAYLGELVELNGLEGSSVPAWTVVLLPAK